MSSIYNNLSSAFDQTSSSSNTINKSRNYHDHIRSLSYLLNETQMKLSQMKELLVRIKEMEQDDPKLALFTEDDGDSVLKAALADAKAAVEVVSSFFSWSSHLLWFVDLFYYVLDTNSLLLLLLICFLQSIF